MPKNKLSQICNKSLEDSKAEDVLNLNVKGISSLERHITLDRSMYGSDQSASLELRGIRELMTGIEKIKSSMGDGEIGKIIEDEKVIAKKLRAHIK